MKGLGERLRARARALGLSDAEIARRAGLSQTRYAGYIIDRYEPDLETFMRICAVLGAPVTEMLGSPVGQADEAGQLRLKVSAALQALDQRSLEVAAIVIDGLVARIPSPPPSTAEDGEE